MSNSSRITGYAYVQGNIMMYNQTKIYENAYVGGNVTLMHAAEIQGGYPLTYTGCPVYTFGLEAYSILTWDISRQ